MCSCTKRSVVSNTRKRRLKKEEAEGGGCGQLGRKSEETGCQGKKRGRGKEREREKERERKREKSYD